ncbi:11689_t:CDS:2 [Racocetra fulgida]|uniref:11689_t:CDS:1 n=1 Tax=Racocetra fulgida TaxID=60492 RepID=A0A9N9F5T0_9GLOM|nr:11689_t:CDS:2 [Racocetra fulgida]
MRAKIRTTDIWDEFRLLKQNVHVKSLNPQELLLKEETFHDNFQEENFQEESHQENFSKRKLLKKFSKRNFSNIWL